MKTTLNRRDFLKLASLMPFISYAPPDRPGSDESRPNILVIVFDALSARNTPFTGYVRNTLPFTSRLADRATVYHNHFSGSNFTTPGTASLLTGTYPWTHRAMRPRHDTIETFADRNMFSLFDDYYRISYTHNSLVSVFQEQFSDHIDLLKPRDDLAFGINSQFLKLFPRDEDIALLSWLRNFDLGETGTTYSLILRYLYEQIGTVQAADFPRGVPHIGGQVNFYLEDAIDWTISALGEIPQPFLGYFHYFPPHDPYNTRKDFVDAFRDIEYPFIEKDTKFSRYFRRGYDQTPQMLQKARREYDEFILYADYEFNRLFNALDEAGILENTWVILTSDHGEIMERARIEHMMELLYMPLVQIPLVVFAPGQQARTDIQTATSAVDILPSILKIAGKRAPAWLEGDVLPPLGGGSGNESRSIYALDAREIYSEDPITRYTGMVIKEDFKLQYYHGYDEMTGVERRYELFDFRKDPEELSDRSGSHRATAEDLIYEVQQKIKAADAPYRNG